jgi:hypothetical protein
MVLLSKRVSSVIGGMTQDSCRERAYCGESRGMQLGKTLFKRSDELRLPIVCMLIVELPGPIVGSETLPVRPKAQRETKHEPRVKKVSKKYLGGA